MLYVSWINGEMQILCDKQNLKCQLNINIYKTKILKQKHFNQNHLQHQVSVWVTYFGINRKNEYIEQAKSFVEKQNIRLVDAGVALKNKILISKTFNSVMYLKMGQQYILHSKKPIYLDKLLTQKKAQRGQIFQ